MLSLPKIKKAAFFPARSELVMKAGDLFHVATFDTAKLINGLN